MAKKHSQFSGNSSKKEPEDPKQPAEPTQSQKSNKSFALGKSPNQALAEENPDEKFTQVFMDDPALTSQYKPKDATADYTPQGPDVDPAAPLTGDPDQLHRPKVTKIDTDQLLGTSRLSSKGSGQQKTSVRPVKSDGFKQMTLDKRPHYGTVAVLEDAYPSKRQKIHDHADDYPDGGEEPVAPYKPVSVKKVPVSEADGLKQPNVGDEHIDAQMEDNLALQRLAKEADEISRIDQSYQVEILPEQQAELSSQESDESTIQVSKEAQYIFANSFKEFEELYKSVFKPGVVKRTTVKVKFAHSANYIKRFRFYGNDFNPDKFPVLTQNLLPPGAALDGRVEYLQQSETCLTEQKGYGVLKICLSQIEVDDKVNYPVSVRQALQQPGPYKIKIKKVSEVPVEKILHGHATPQVPTCPQLKKMICAILRCGMHPFFRQSSGSHAHHAGWYNEFNFERSWLRVKSFLKDFKAYFGRSPAKELTRHAPLSVDIHHFELHIERLQFDFGLRNFAKYIVDKKTADTEEKERAVNVFKYIGTKMVGDTKRWLYDRNLHCYARSADHVGFYPHIEFTDFACLEPRFEDHNANLLAESHQLRALQQFHMYVQVIENALCDPNFPVCWDGLMGGLMLLDLLDYLIERVHASGKINRVSHVPKQGVFAFAGGIADMSQWVSLVKFGKRYTSLQAEKDKVQVDAIVQMSADPALRKLADDLKLTEKVEPPKKKQQKQTK